jgi:hypothetical protein
MVRNDGGLVCLKFLFNGSIIITLFTLLTDSFFSSLISLCSSLLDCSFLSSNFNGELFWLGIEMSSILGVEVLKTGYEFICKIAGMLLSVRVGGRNSEGGSFDCFCLGLSNKARCILSLFSGMFTNCMPSSSSSTSKSYSYLI